MIKTPLINLKLTSGRIIILLIIAGMAYLIWPRIMYSDTPQLQPSTSVTVMAVPPMDAPSLSTNHATLTSTPTPEKLTPVAAQVTTPTPEVKQTELAVSSRPVLVNQATADYQNALATADALINGTATPTPLNSGTTSLLIPTATGTSTPSPTSIVLMVVTETPTPLNIITVAAQAARATAVAETVGTFTPVPFNWVVPIVITPEPATPIPANAATVAFQAAEATASAFVYGTPTPLPINVWTATPTPFMQMVNGQVATPWIPPSPTPTPLPMPRELVGKILFLSNRSGGPEPLEQPLVYVIDPDGSNLAVLNDDALYQAALIRDTYSADQRYRTFIQLIPRYPAETPGQPRVVEMIQAIFMYDYHYKVEEQITYFGAGEAWAPAWSPTQEQIALVSDDSAHAEIWVVNRDGSGAHWLTQTNPIRYARQIGKDTFNPDEENGHPSWSPDGSKIVFWSTRNGLRQIFVMNADGSNPYSLSTTSHEDWDPVWVKYTDPARVPEFGIKFPPSNTSIPPDYQLVGPEKVKDRDSSSSKPTAEPPSEEPPGEEPPGEEPPGEEPPGEEPPGEEPPGEEPPGEEPPGEEPPGEEPPGEEPPDEEPPDEEPTP